MARIKSHVLTTRVEQRISCTGEPARLVLQQLGADGGPLMPEAVDGQHELEAALLVAINIASRRLAQNRGVSRVEPIVRQVRLAAHALWLEVADDAVEWLLGAALPFGTETGLTGIAGLRPRPSRDHLDLVLVGLSGGQAGVVRLSGVNQARWRSVARRLEEEFGSRRAIWRSDPDQCTAVERQALHSATAAPTELMSAVLRRFPLWRRAAWVEASVKGSALRMQWEDGPADAVVAEILAHSACRIPGVSVARRHVSDRFREILMSYTAAAQAVAEPTLRPAAAVPGAVWDQQEMRDALARREISSVYRLLRRHGVSQREIAARTGQSQSEVSAILKGREVMAYDALLRTAVSLGVPRGYMGLAYAETTAMRVAAAADPTCVADDEAVKRRKFLAHAAAVTVGAAVFRPNFRSQVPHHTQHPTPGRIGMTDVRQVEAATKALRALEDQYGGGSCRDAAVAQLSWAQQMLPASSSERVRQRLRAALIELRKLAVWTPFDGRKLDSVHNSSREAVDLAARVRNVDAHAVARSGWRHTLAHRERQRGPNLSDWARWPTIKSAGGILMPVISAVGLQAPDRGSLQAS